MGQLMTLDMYWKSRHIFLNVDGVSFIVSNDEITKPSSKTIMIRGRLDYDNAINIQGSDFGLRLSLIPDDFEYPKISGFKNIQVDQNQDLPCCGTALLMTPGTHLEKKTMDIDIRINREDFSDIKYVLDKYLSGTIDLIVGISVCGLKIGHEPIFDEFPEEQHLPIVGYRFIAHSKEK